MYVIALARARTAIVRVHNANHALHYQALPIRPIYTTTSHTPTTPPTRHNNTLPNTTVTHPTPHNTPPFLSFTTGECHYCHADDADKLAQKENGKLIRITIQLSVTCNTCIQFVHEGFWKGINEGWNCYLSNFI